jgi:hypothetical protein
MTLTGGALPARVRPLDCRIAAIRAELLRDRRRAGVSAKCAISIVLLQVRRPAGPAWSEVALRRRARAYGIARSICRHRVGKRLPGSLDVEGVDVPACDRGCFRPISLPGGDCPTATGTDHRFPGICKVIAGGRIEQIGHVFREAEHAPTGPSAGRCKRVVAGPRQATPHSHRRTRRFAPFWGDRLHSSSTTEVIMQKKPKSASVRRTASPAKSANANEPRMGTKIASDDLRRNTYTQDRPAGLHVQVLGTKR